MKDIKELRKEMRMLRLEDQWLKAKADELKASLVSNRHKMKQIRQEIQKSKPTKEVWASLEFTFLDAFVYGLVVNSKIPIYIDTSYVPTAPQAHLSHWPSQDWLNDYSEGVGNR